jgi:hypothetical protein
VVSQASRHRGRAGPPLFGRARAVGRDQLWHGLADAGVRQDTVVIHVIQGQLLPSAVLTLAQRGNATPDRRHMLAPAEVEAVTVDGGIAPSTSASKPCVPLLRHTAPQ